MSTPAALERQPKVTGGLAELHRRLAMERGDHPAPPGTTREQRQFTIRLRAGSINEAALRDSRKGLHGTAKIELQGALMRELDRFKYLLPKPIPSVGHDGQRAPVWAHVRLRFPTHARRDVENFRVLISKALGDALTGPKWQGQGKTMRPANRRLTVGGRIYVGGWLEEDTHRDWLLTLDFDEETGTPSIQVTLVWDQPA